MTPRLVPTVGIALVALALTATACSSSGDDGGNSAPAQAATSAAGPAAGSSAAAAPATEAEAETTACKTDSNYLSGSSTIVWTPDAKSKHQVAEATAANKFTLTAAGKLEPASIEVAADEVFTVTLAQDSKGVSVLKIGCDGGQTLPKGVPAGVYITTPGTYEVKSGITEQPAGTITVK